MLFLNPTILFALLAAAIPVLIHMLNLRKLKKVDFSTLKFLKEIQKSKIRKIKFKQWLLLALRVLIILFTVFAFARPALKGIALAGTTSSSKTSAVFILDDSFSMSFVETNGSLFNQAKSEINKILSQLKEGDDSELILLSNSKLSNYKLSKNLSFLKTKIRKVKISSVTGSLDNAVKNGLNMLASSKNFNKELYILSDFQKRNLSYNISKNKNTFENIRLYTITFGGSKYQNVGIDKFTLGTQIFEKNKPIIFKTSITNYSHEKVNDIVLSLFINGKRKSQKNLSLNPGASTSLEMSSNVSSSGFISAFVEIDDDVILQDNKRYVNFYIPEKINVGLFSDNSYDKQFILPALTSHRNNNNINIVEANSNQLASLNLTNFDVIIFIPSKTITNLNRLQKYIKSGGSLVLLPGSSINETKFQNILSGLKVTANVKSSGKINTNENYLSFDKIDFTHPVFENLFAKNKEKEVDSPKILFHLNIDYKNLGRYIITLNDKSHFLTEIKHGLGKIFIFNTAPVLSWSNLPIKGIFAPLINKSIYYLSFKNVSHKNYIVGNEVGIKINNAKKGLLKIVKPNKSVEYITLDESKNNDYINYKMTDQIGVYKVTDGKTILSMFNVNADPNESVQKYITLNEFKEYLEKINFNGKYIAIDKSEEVLSVVQQARFGSELWKLFIIIALCLAVIEMLVSKSAKKDIAVIK
ncbi:MAG: BatA domain-containing protein [Bacteroidetes bacterium]|nr:BatA domain-containing protein [Bacteroidota bacterium]